MLPVGVKPKISQQMNTMRAFVEVWVFSRLNCSTFCNYHVVVVGKSHSLCSEWNHMQRFHGCIYGTSEGLKHEGPLFVLRRDVSRAIFGAS